MTSFVTTGKLAGLSVDMYNMQPLFEMANNGENYAYYTWDITVLKGVQHDDVCILITVAEDDGIQPSFNQGCRHHNQACDH